MISGSGIPCRARRQNGWRLVAAISLLATLDIACENYAPGEEQVISSLDKRGCEFLFDTLSTEVTTTGVQDLQTNWISAADTLIGQLYDTLLIETSFTIDYVAAGPDSSYALFYQAKQGTESGEIIFLLNDYLDLELVGKDGQTVTHRSNVIPLETLAGCFDLKTRLEFDLGAGPYLVRFIINESSRLAPLRLAVLTKNDG